MSDEFEANIDVDLNEINDIIEEMEEAKGYVENEAPYALYVEYPTQYNTGPPLTPIRRWTYRNWSNLSGGIKSEFQNGYDNGSIKHKQSVARAIRESINKSGTEGVYFMTRAKNKAEGNVKEFIEEYEGKIQTTGVFSDIIEDILEFVKEESEDIIVEEANDKGELLESNTIVMHDELNDKDI